MRHASATNKAIAAMVRSGTIGIRILADANGVTLRGTQRLKKFVLDRIWEYNPSRVGGPIYQRPLTFVGT